MQLLYVWIEKYKNIKEQGFNFSSEFFFKYNEKDNELIIEDNSNYIPNFFNLFNDEEHKGYANIFNISAIIGANGSGKTTLLRFIHDGLFNSLSNPRNSLIIVKEGEKINVYFKNNFKLIYNTINKNFLEIKDKAININLKIISLCNAVYGADIYGDMPNPTLKNKLQDLTLLKMLSRARKEYPRLSITEGLHQIEFQNQIRLFHLFNWIPLTNNNKDTIVFQFPNYLSFSFEYDAQRAKNFIYQGLQNKLRSETKQQKDVEKNNKAEKYFSDKYNEFENIIEHYENLFKEYNNKANLFVDNIALALLSNILVFISSISISINIEFDKTKTIKENIKDITDMLNSNLRSSNQSFEQGRIALQYLTYIETISKTKFSEEMNGILLELKDNNTIVSFITEYNKTIFLTESFFNHISDIRFLKHQWNIKYENNSISPRKMSSGEEAILALFGRLSTLYNPIIESEDDEILIQESQNILLLIDEIDLYVHPQWQKQLIKILVESLPFFFYQEKADNKINVQVILTSHSPFVISDLPKENIIFLEKDNEAMCKVENGIKMEQTFGANIHTLLADGFFMKDGLMGEFAKAKIKEIIEWIKEPKADKKDEILKVIEIIGEPIIGDKLRQYFKEEFGKESAKEKVERLRRELAEAEEEAKKSNK